MHQFYSGKVREALKYFTGSKSQIQVAKAIHGRASKKATAKNYIVQRIKRLVEFGFGCHGKTSKKKPSYSLENK